MSSWTIISRARAFASGAVSALTLSAASLAQGGGIEVQSLDALDPLEVGLPGAAFSMTLWDGSTGDTALAALAALPGPDEGAGYSSHALSELARAVLVSGGYPPAGGRGRADLATTRSDRLLAAGGVMDAFDLLERTPNINTSPTLARRHAELALAAEAYDRACYTANALIANRDAPYWLRVRALCLALEDQSSAAELTAELASGVEADADYDRLLFALTLGRPLTGNPIMIDSGLDYALTRLVQIDDPALVQLGETSPAWLRRFVELEPLPNFLYSTAPAADLERAAGLEGLEREHLLISVLAQGEDRERAAGALSLLLDDAAASGDMLAAMRLYGAEVNTLPQTEATLADGVRFAMAAALAGDVRTARAWKNGLIDGPRRPVNPFPEPVQAETVTEDPLKTGMAQIELPMPGADDPAAPVTDWRGPDAAQLVAVDLAILLASGDVDSPATEAVLAAAYESQGDVVLADFLALQRLGAPVPTGLRAGLTAREPVAIPVELLAMEEALVAGAETEAVLFAVSALAGMEDATAVEILPRAATVLAEADLSGALLQLLLERHVARHY